MNRTKRILAVVIVVLICCFLLCGCIDKPSNYTLEEHIARVKPLIEKRYCNDGDTPISYEIYPLYNAEDELQYLLVEFEPCGFVFIYIGEENRIISTLFRVVGGMYNWEDRYLAKVWQRYRLCVNGKEPEPYNGVQWQAQEGPIAYEDYRYEVDADSNFIEYNRSPFKVANVLDQRLYFLDIYHGYVPAIKHNGKFINLVSLEEYEYQGYKFYKKYYNLVPPRLEARFVND